MAQGRGCSLLQLLQCKCKCECHQAIINGVENSSNNGCSDVQCRCGKITTKSSQQNMRGNITSLGRVDHNTSFRPIIPRDVGCRQFQNSQEVLSDSFNILTLQNLRTETLDALNSQPNFRQVSDASAMHRPATPTGTPDTFMTPQDFLNSSNKKSSASPSSQSVRKSNNSTGASLPSLPDTRSSVSRSTPLTVQDLSTRLITPDEFLKSSQITEMQNRRNSPSVGVSAGSVMDQSRVYNNISSAPKNKSNYPDSCTKLPHTTIPVSSASSSVKPANSNPGSTNPAPESQLATEPANPLSEFCNKIGVTADHNPLLPTIPGGESIKQRLITPDPNVLESLRRNMNGEAEKSSEGEATKAVNQPVLSLEDMPYKNGDGEKPYIAVFWDIENCHVPRRKDASSIVRLVRDKFYGQHVEYEFYVVMDVLKEKEELSRELLRAQVTIVHVSKGEKNAADEKLVYLMRRYSTYHQYGNTCVLISGDTNFTPVLHDMRHKHHINIKMVEYHPEAKFLAIHGLPHTMDYRLVKNRLHMLCENLGGKVFQVYGHHAYIDMRDPSSAIRAKNHLDGEAVYSHRICCTITNACSLSNFQLACANSDVEHHCSVGDDPSQQDNLCPRFNAPHYSYNKYPTNGSGNNGAGPGCVYQNFNNGGNGGGYACANNGAFGYSFGNSAVGNSDRSNPPPSEPPALPFQPFDLLESEDGYGANFFDMEPPCGSPYSNYMNSRNFSGPNSTRKMMVPSRGGGVPGRASFSSSVPNSALYGDCEHNFTDH
ncbi:uncharacterized protein LOC125179011 [Hyalella azteca]|uniref:Uncharacterized protein LOC125179011 n=1 Tax=Hyalella azteca TaxID=294128 RepID=A0A979FTR0_HYAAZ|nr:uncharacterized protein LOC125179011 [Hyalella azteca]